MALSRRGLGAQFVATFRLSRRLHDEGQAPRQPALRSCGGTDAVLSRGSFANTRRVTPLAVVMAKRRATPPGAQPARTASGYDSGHGESHLSAAGRVQSRGRVVGEAIPLSTARPTLQPNEPQNNTLELTKARTNDIPPSQLNVVLARPGRNPSRRWRSERKEATHCVEAQR